MSPLGITLLMLVAFAGFGYYTWRKLSIVVALQPEVRWDNPGTRLLEVVKNGFLQERMIEREWKPGIMHATIFIGFMSLLVRKVQLLVIGYYEPFTYPGLFGGVFATLKDVVEVAVLVAVGYAFYRRLVQKPQRLERNREALLVLSLITAIMITDFAFDAFRFTLFSAKDPEIAYERGFAFIGSWLATQVAGWSPTALKVGYEFSYWAQLVVVFAFLVLLPLGEHFHIVTALPTLFFRKGRPTNQVPKVDLDAIMGDSGGSGGDEGEMKIGVATAKDLVWKEGLDAFTCTECGRCKDACPTFLTGKPLSLKWVNDSLKHHLLDKREAIIAGKEDALPPLVGEVIKEETLWACTTCGYCEAACPIELEHLAKFFRMRQHRVLMDGEFPKELKPVFDAYEVQSNPWGLAADTRGKWAEGLNVPVVSTADEVKALDYLFYVGSAESFDPRGQKIATAFVKLLQAAGVKFGILGPAETSTGECVRRAGNEMLFQTLAPALVETLNGLGVTKIVTCDPHAFNSLVHEYPAFNGKYEVIHHTQLIAQLIAQGRLKLDRKLERVIYHEPCYLGRHNGEYEAPRAIVRALVKDVPLEFDLHREKAMCCGAGGGRMWLEESIGKRINVTRVEQALPHAPKVIATACPYCAVMMHDGIAALEKDSEIKALDLAELVAAALPGASSGTSAAAAPASAGPAGS